MNNRFLTATRALLGVAVAITGFITRNAAAITRGAEIVHDKALDLANHLAERRVKKAWDRYDGTLKVIGALRKQASDDYDAFTAASDVRDRVYAGTIAERATLSAA